MENELPKRLRVEDCRIDWEHFPVKDLDGKMVVENVSPEEAKRRLAEWIEDECSCSEYKLAGKVSCYLYYIYSHGYDEDKYKQYAQQQNYKEDTIAFWGLQEMFDDEWVKSPAFVDWRDEMKYCIDNRNIRNFILGINNPQTRVEILSHLFKNAEYIFMMEIARNFEDRDYLKRKKLILKQLLETQKAAAKIRKEELKRRETEERAKNKTKKEQPIYSLSVEEIIQYVREENPDAAPAIRGMLRYFADEKEGWNNKAIKAMLEPIKAQNFNFYAPVENAIGNVEKMNTTKE